MSDITTNPLYQEGLKRFKEDWASGQFDLHVGDARIYILGFLRGVSYATGVQQKELADLEQKIKNISHEQ